MATALPTTPITTRKNALRPSTCSANSVSGRNAAVKVGASPAPRQTAPRLSPARAPTNAQAATSARPAAPRTASAASAPSGYAVRRTTSMTGTAEVISRASRQQHDEQSQERDDQVRQVRVGRTRLDRAGAEGQYFHSRDHRSIEIALEPGHDLAPVLDRLHEVSG